MVLKTENLKATYGIICSRDHRGNCQNSTRYLYPFYLDKGLTCCESDMPYYKLKITSYLSPLKWSPALQKKYFCKSPKIAM